MLAECKIGFLGAGNMAEALIHGLIKTAVVPPEQILCANRQNKERLSDLKSRFGVTVMDDPRQLVRDSDVLVLAMKPKDLEEALGPLGAEISAKTLVVSLLAGTPSAKVEALLPHNPPVVRSMPNTCSTIRESVTSIAAGRFAQEQDLKRCEELFGAVGLVLRVSERDLDAVTGLSGSGPAYVYLMIESLIAAGVAHGLDPNVARTLATQTVVGAGRMVQESDEAPAELRRKVTSRGGTTQAGLGVLERRGFASAVGEAVSQATQRSKELANPGTQMLPPSVRRIVVKVGSSTITFPSGHLHQGQVDHLSAQLADLRHMGLEIVLVSSGAIAAGMGRQGLQQRPGELPAKQALAAVGQPLLMQAYQRAFGEHGQAVAQVLLTSEDMVQEQRRRHCIDTIEQLLNWNILPIVNENDTVATDEIAFGDNDTLAAQVALLLNADLLVILTDIDGVYAFDPKLEPTAKPLRLIVGDAEIDTGTPGPQGTGGMATKVAAARLAGAAGITTIIAHGAKADVLRAAIAGEEVGTTWQPSP